MIVNLELETSGGIFTSAEVTYRGVPVGRVGNMSLAADGVVVELRIDKTAPHIPASAKAVVAKRSAIGEQYVDLQPSVDRGPFLADGSRIAAVDASTPVPVEELLASTRGLTESVPIDALHTVVTELGAAFDGKGEDLQSLAGSLSGLSTSGADSLDRTVALIRDSRTVLGTQSEQSSAIEDFSADLDSLADRLRSSDPDARRLIDNGNPASEQLGQLVSDVGPGGTTNLAGLSVTAKAISVQATALRTLFVYLPGVAAASSTIAPDDGTVHLGLIAETNNPPSCTVGYEGTQTILAEMKRNDPNFDDTQQDFPQNTAASCEAPQGSLTGVRSANRIVFGDPATFSRGTRNPRRTRTDWTSTRLRISSPRCSGSPPTDASVRPDPGTLPGFELTTAPRSCNLRNRSRVPASSPG